MLLLYICSTYFIFSDCTYGLVCLLYISLFVHISYLVLGIDGVMYMLDMQCCVHMVLCTCCICSAMYI